MDTRLDVNVALGRPASQPSTYDDSNGIYYAMYANDGGLGTHMLYGPCAITNTETNPWWSVDLGVELYVDSVNFTNRGDGSRTYTVYWTKKRVPNGHQRCSHRRKRRGGQEGVGTCPQNSGKIFIGQLSCEMRAFFEQTT